jgi:hypothetical protein
MSTLNVTTIIPDVGTNTDLSLDGKGDGNVAIVDDATVGGEITVTGTTTLTGAATLSSTLEVTGASTLAALTASGVPTFSSTSDMSVGGDIVMTTASSGIYLGVTSATATNLLDDYEYGNWTPGLTSTSATFGYTTQVGTYAKAGKLVMLNFRIALNGSPGGTTTNSVFISGAPFSQFGDSPFFGGHIGHFYNVNLDSNEQAGVAWQANGGTSFELKGLGDNVGEQSIITSQLGAAFEIRGSINYIAA